MQVIGFSDEDILSTYKLLASILKLGNIEFKAYTTMDGIEGVKITNEQGMWSSMSVCLAVSLFVSADFCEIFALTYASGAAAPEALCSWSTNYLK